jgi:hypothetical protein
VVLTFVDSVNGVLRLLSCTTRYRPAAEGTVNRPAISGAVPTWKPSLKTVTLAVLVAL